VNESRFMELSELIDIAIAQPISRWHKQHQSPGPAGLGLPSEYCVAFEKGGITLDRMLIPVGTSEFNAKDAVMNRLRNAVLERIPVFGRKEIYLIKIHPCSCQELEMSGYFTLDQRLYRLYQRLRNIG